MMLPVYGCNILLVFVQGRIQPVESGQQVAVERPVTMLVNGAAQMKVHGLGRIPPLFGYAASSGKRKKQDNTCKKQVIFFHAFDSDYANFRYVETCQVCENKNTAQVMILIPGFENIRIFRVQSCIQSD